MTSVQKLTGVERVFNGFIGMLFRKGLSPSYGHQLEVTGRKSGRAFTTPVNLLDHAGELYLVAPRGETQWVKNARAAGEVVLRRKASATRYRVRELPVERRPPVLAAYLQAYVGQVQRFFSVKAGSPPEAFAAIAEQHPVFSLEPIV